ncbi:MAG TPA: hypothetical protein EYO84_04055, partial [Planctomycetes bacterium]|nr:hypothetical protein [Planctomycetota bacterium]
RTAAVSLLAAQSFAPVPDGELLIVGNSMNAITISLERLFSELRARRQEVELVWLESLSFWARISPPDSGNRYSVPVVHTKWRGQDPLPTSDRLHWTRNHPPPVVSAALRRSPLPSDDSVPRNR